jgi:hypothetical protein
MGSGLTTPSGLSVASKDTSSEWDYEKEAERIKMKYKRRAADGLGGEYSDAEVEVETIQKRRTTARRATTGDDTNAKDSQPWSPAFLAHSPSTKSPEANTNQDELGYNNLPVAVPATPSLIKAIDRIAVAQRDAYGAQADYFGNRGPPQAKTHPARISRSPSLGQERGQPRTPLSPLNPTSHDDVLGKEQRRERAKRMEDAERVMKGRMEALGDRQPRTAGIASDDDDSDGEDLEGGRERGRVEKAPKWEEFWREVRAKVIA